MDELEERVADGFEISENAAASNALGDGYWTLFKPTLDDLHENSREFATGN